jgi:hypothetical protein
MSLQALNRLSKAASRLTLTGLAVPAVLLLSQGRAEAILTYYIFEDAGSLKIQTKGSLNLTDLTSQDASACTTTPGGGFAAGIAICSGIEPVGDTNLYRQYSITNATPFTAGSGILSPATSTFGIANWVNNSNPNKFSIYNYTSGAEIASYAIFSGSTLTSVGLDSISSGTTIGSWFLGADASDTTRQINVIVGAPPADPAPAPLPLLGAAGAFGWSRRLRRRISTAGSR